MFWPCNGDVQSSYFPQKANLLSFIAPDAIENYYFFLLTLERVNSIDNDVARNLFFDLLSEQSNMTLVRSDNTNLSLEDFSVSQ